jgi:tetratricopeptide (TPR) repeat protein
MSVIHAKKQDAAAAEKALDHALALRPGNISILRRAALLQLALKQPQKALEKCREQMKTAPDAEAEIRLLMSGIYDAQKEYSRAEDEIRRVMELKPESSVPYISLGRLYARQGELEDGIREFEAALKKQPDSPRLKMTIATLCMVKEDFDSALHWYERTVKEHDDFIPGLNNLAYLYAKKYPTQENLASGLALVEKIPEAYQNKHSLDTLGWIHYQRGNYGEAVKVLEPLSAENEDPMIQVHLGLAYLKSNDSVQALTMLEKALEQGGRGLSKDAKQMAEEALQSLKG